MLEIAALRTAIAVEGLALPVVTPEHLVVSGRCVGQCGNGIVEPGEQCDGANLQGFDCVSLGLSGGTLSCDPVTCTFDTSMCTN